MNDIRLLFDIELPLIQAPMAGVQDSALAIAVCEAGGLGSLPCAMLSPEAMRREVELLQHSRGPFNLNFFCHRSPEPDPLREDAWRQRLEPYYKEFGVDVASINTGPGRRPFDESAAGLVEEFRPAVVSFHFGLPAPDLLARVKATGAKVLSSATTVEEARWLAARGVDAIIAQGLEAGGHRGMFLSLDLATQQERDDLLRGILAVVDIPVIAAGGIATAAEVREAIAAGAAGVQVGTPYLLCPEATTSAVHRAALQSVASRETVVTNVFTGRPARGIVNRFIRELGPMNADVPAFPLAANSVAPLRAEAEARGSGDFSPLWAGAKASTVEARTAAELTKRLGDV